MDLILRKSHVKCLKLNSIEEVLVKFLRVQIRIKIENLNWNLTIERWDDFAVWTAALRQFPAFNVLDSFPFTREYAYRDNFAIASANVTLMTSAHCRDSR